ncbi:type IV pilus twitching motility protein PilT [Planctomycetota bacterium]
MSDKEAKAGSASVSTGGAEAGDEGGKVEARSLALLLRTMARLEASDLHLKLGSPPIFRINTKVRLSEAKPLGHGDVEALVEPILDGDHLERFRRGVDVDMAYSLEGIGRYRLNIFRQRGSVSVAIRRVSVEIPTFAELNLPIDVMQSIASERRGLVLVCGVTGSGKSTTLAAVLDHINSTRRCHIVTIEDPIEYLYQDKRSFVNQREIGLDVEDFYSALKYVVRQDPDVILIGEMRDRDTFEAGLAAAETGHLVFGTLHSSTVGATIGRIMDLFPGDRERQIRQSLRFNLRAIVCQKILKGARSDAPLVPGLEILLVNAAARKAVAEGDDKKLDQIVRGGREEGMIDFNSSLLALVQQGLISEETALDASQNPEQLKINLRGIFLGDDRKILS